MKWILIIVLCCSLITNVYGQSIKDSNNGISASMATRLLIDGQQNATYDLMHSFSLSHGTTLSEKLDFLSTIAYLNAPWNSNFKFHGAQAKLGLKKHLFSDKISIKIHGGLEYSNEQYAYDLNGNKIRDSILNLDPIFNLGMFLSLDRSVDIGVSSDLVPSKRFSIGLKLNVLIFKIK